MSDHDNIPDDEFEYAGVFADATMDDFLRETSARSIVPRTDPARETWGRFVDEQLRAVRTAWIASETYMQPLAIVATEDEQRIFIPDDDETMRQFIGRMHREAKAMSATWTFIAQRTMVASLGEDDGTYDKDVDDPETIQQAIAEGLAVLGVQWYAERREGGNIERRHGQMHDEAGTLGRLREGGPNQKIPLFEQILGS